MTRERCTGRQFAVLFMLVCWGQGLASASPILGQEPKLPWFAAILTTDERPDVEGAATKHPQIDLEIYFDFGSAVLQPKTIPALHALGTALSSSELKDFVFLIAGHTDGLESDDYASVLSLRRATAVKEYLVKHFKILRENLVVVGFGSKELKDVKNPFAEVNRRVQIMNLESSR